MLISVALTRTVTSAVSLIIVAVNDEAKVAAVHNAAQIAAVHNAGQTAAVHNAPHTVAVHNAPQTPAQSPVGTKSFRSGIRLPVRGTATAVATHDAAPTIATHDAARTHDGAQPSLSATRRRSLQGRPRGGGPATGDRDPHRHRHDAVVDGRDGAGEAAADADRADPARAMAMRCRSTFNAATGRLQLLDRLEGDRRDDVGAAVLRRTVPTTSPRSIEAPRPEPVPDAQVHDPSCASGPVRSAVAALVFLARSARTRRVARRATAADDLAG